MGAGRTNPQLVRYVIAHLLAVVAEWAVFIALLVYVHDRAGAGAMGVAAVVMLVPYVVVSPFAGQLAERHRPSRVRLAGLAGQTVGYGIAAITAYQEAPTWMTIAGAVFALGSVTTLRPAGAVMLPALVHSSRQLTTANLWVGHTESASVLVGPIVTTGLLAIDGAAFALAGCALLAAAALAVAASGATVDPPAGQGGTSAVRHASAALRAIRSRPGGTGVLAVAVTQYVLVGALDLVVVVSAEDVLDMGETGVGVLSTLFGLGAAASTVVSAMLVRRRRLAPFLLTCLAALAAMCGLLGAHITLVTALIALPILGVGRSVLDLLSRMLLQRSAPPNELGGVFALVEVGSGLGLVAGSLLGQVLIAASGPGAALLGVAVVFGVLLVLVGSSLRTADDGADVPVVEMSLLRLDPVFSPLPAIELEAVARAATEVEVPNGGEVIRQGEPGDTYFVVASGAFEVAMDGHHVRTVARGGSFGEVALLADVARTGSVTATTDGTLLAIDRVPFLVAVTGHDSSRQAAWGVIRTMDLGFDVSEHATSADPPPPAGAEERPATSPGDR